MYTKSVVGPVYVSAGSESKRVLELLVPVLFVVVEECVKVSLSVSRKTVFVSASRVVLKVEATENEKLDVTEFVVVWLFVTLYDSGAPCGTKK
jgi:hypothetical protein